MTKQERIEKLNQIEAKLIIGKRLCVKFPEARLALTHPRPGVWHVNASYRTMRESESYDADDDSRICDCDFSGTPHAHFRADYTVYADAMTAFADAEQAIQGRQPVALPEQWLPAAA